MIRRQLVRILTLALLPWMCGMPLLQADPPQDAKKPDVPTATAPDPAAVAKQDEAAAKIDRILTDLQKRSDGLTDIRCRVKFVEKDEINISERTKIGTILFLITEPNPHFLIHFEKTEVDGIRVKQEWYLFDGRWLYEAIERLQQVTKREMVPEGEKLNLYDLKAPFPLPFGQQKEKILKNFDVELVAPAKGDPKDTDHLVCVPKPGSAMEKKYDKLEFFVRRDLHLPSRVIVTKNEGLEINTADFPDLSAGSINAGLTKKNFARPGGWKGFKEVVEEN